MAKMQNGVVGIDIREGAIPTEPALSFLFVCLRAAYGNRVEPEQFREVAAGILAEDLKERQVRSAWDGQKLVGIAVGVWRQGMFYLWGVYVSPTLFRQGIGRRLVSNICAEQPPGTICEVHVLPESPALEFWTAQGFAITEEADEEVFPGHTSSVLLMHRRLG